MKTLIYHDTFLMKWWAERMNIEIAKILHADIATAIWKDDCYDARSMGFDKKIIEVHPTFKRWMLGFLKMKLAFFLSSIPNQYEAVLFSNEAITGIHRVPKNIKTFYYAHSISRHLFDLEDIYRNKVIWYMRFIFIIANTFFRILYIYELKKVWTLFVNSSANKKRIEEWIGRNDAIILSPPVDTSTFFPYKQEEIAPYTSALWLEYKNYYISFARLTHIKRIDSIIEAFKELKDKKVLILYGTYDSQKDEFMESWKGHKNIIFHHLNDNSQLPFFISGAVASLAISKQEDFWMVAIESMACGVPVIAVEEGWYIESMIPEKTGMFISENYTSKELQEAVQKMNYSLSLSMQESCRERAQKYSLTAFRENLLKYI